MKPMTFENQLYPITLAPDGAGYTVHITQDRQWRIQRGGRGPCPPYKPMSGRLTSCLRRKDKRIMVSSYKELNVANA